MDVKEFIPYDAILEKSDGTYIGRFWFQGRIFYLNVWQGEADA